MSHFKLPALLASLLLALATSPSYAASNFCIAVNNGFVNGGTSFIGTGFVLPANGTCSPWAGFTKTASTVILTSTGTGCVSTSGKVLTVSLMHADPSYFGPGSIQADYVRLTRSSTSVGFGTGMDSGYFGASAKAVTCSSTLLSLPDNHD